MRAVRTFDSKNTIQSLNMFNRVAADAMQRHEYL